MSRKKKNTGWKEIDGKAAFTIPMTLLRHPNMVNLSPYGHKLIMDLGKQYTGFNNGYSSGFNADPLHRGLWTASRRALVDWVEAMRSGRLTSTDRYNSCQTDSHRHDGFVSRRLAA